MIKSPFPGMDPYLEARWSDVHTRLITYIGDSLQPTLPSGLRARVEERIVLEDVGGERLPAKRYDADVAVVEGPPSQYTPSDALSGTVVVPEPYVVEFHDAPATERSLLIVDTGRGNRVVTAIELLSPGNKSPGRLNVEYWRKVEDYAAAGISLVEIDLLRSPRGRLKIREEDVPAKLRTPYLACVRRAWALERWDLYNLPLRAPLPPIRIPLRRTDRDAILRLQPLIEQAYSAGGYDDIDYSKPPVPPLDPEDEAWADQLLRQAGRR